VSKRSDEEVKAHEERLERYLGLDPQELLKEAQAVDALHRDKTAPASARAHAVECAKDLLIVANELKRSYNGGYDDNELAD